MPRFACDHDIEMSGALKTLGMTKPFDAAEADLSALGSSGSGNIFISRVLQRRISPWMKKAQNRCGDLARKVQQGHLLQAADHFITSGWIALYDRYI